MAVFQGSIFSKALKMDTHVTVILPKEVTIHPMKALYLLHGYSDDCTSWQRKTRIEEYIKETDIAVICPEVAHSFYLNMRYGQDYSDFIQHELVSICENTFNLSSKSKDRYIAGLSMGGYGALRTCLLDPKRYSGCGCFSGAIDLRSLLSQNDEPSEEWTAVLGKDMTIEDDQDVFLLLNKIQNKKITTSFYVTCGKQDFLFDSYKKWEEKTAGLRLNIINESWNGTHEWTFWDESIKRFLDKVVKEK